MNRPAVSANATSRPVAAQLGKSGGDFLELWKSYCHLLTDDTLFSIR